MCACVCYYHFLFIGFSVKLDDVPKLMKLLVPIQNKFAEVALALDVPDFLVDETNSKSNIIKLKDVLNLWIENKSTDATWEVLLAAIEGPIVHNRAISDAIREFISVKNSATKEGKN